LPISNSILTSNNNSIFYVTRKDIYEKENSLKKAKSRTSLCFTKIL